MRRADPQPPQLLHVLHGVTQQSGGEQEQQQTHDAEETAIVQAVAEFINGGREAQRGHNAEQPAQHEQRATLLERERQREDGGFHSFAPDGRERQQAQRQRRPTSRGCLSGQLLPHGPAVSLHPEGHAGEQDDRHHVRESLEDRLEGGSHILAHRHKEQRAAASGGQHGQPHTRPHRAYLPARLPQLLQRREQNAHDHAGFQSLAQEQDEGWDHRWPSRPLLPSLKSGGKREVISDFSSLILAQTAYARQRPRQRLSELSAAWYTNGRHLPITISSRRACSDTESKYY